MKKLRLTKWDQQTQAFQPGIRLLAITVMFLLSLVMLYSSAAQSDSPTLRRQNLAQQRSATQNPPGRITPATSKGSVFPFSYDPILNPQIIIQVSINDNKPLPFVVDTGTSVPIMITTWAAQRLKLTVDKAAKVQVLGRSQGNFTAPLRRLQILTPDGPANFQLAHLPAVVYDLPFVDGGKSGSQSRTVQLAGIIGIPILAGVKPGFAFQLDFAAHCMRVCHVPTRLLPDPTMTVLPLRLAPRPREDYIGSTYNVSVVLPSRSSVDCLLDTGTSENGIFNLGAFPFPAAGMAKQLFNRGAILVFEDAALLPQLDSGSLTYTPLCFSREYSPTPSSLGVNFLSHFTVTLDFARRRLILQRPVHAPSPPVYGAADVLLQQQGQGYEVVSVVPATPAAQSGLLSGDRVISVDRHTLAGLLPITAQWVIDGDAGTRARLKVQRAGTVLHLTYMRRSLFDGSHDATAGIPFGLSKGILYTGPVTPGSPADAAGLHEGDHVTELNGLPTSSLSAGQILADLNAAQVSLTVTRQGVADPLHFQFPAPPVPPQAPAPPTPQPPVTPMATPK